MPTLHDEISGLPGLGAPECIFSPSSQTATWPSVSLKTENGAADIAQR